MTNNRVRHSHEDEYEAADAGLVIQPIHADTLDAYLQQLFDETSCECHYDFDAGLRTPARPRKLALGTHDVNVPIGACLAEVVPTRQLPIAQNNDSGGGARWPLMSVEEPRNPVPQGRFPHARNR